MRTTIDFRILSSGIQAVDFCNAFMRSHIFDSSIDDLKHGFLFRHKWAENIVHTVNKAAQFKCNFCCFTCQKFLLLVVPPYPSSTLPVWWKHEPIHGHQQALSQVRTSKALLGLPCIDSQLLPQYWTPLPTEQDDWDADPAFAVVQKVRLSLGIRREIVLGRSFTNWKSIPTTKTILSSQNIDNYLLYCRW